MPHRLHHLPVSPVLSFWRISLSACLAAWCCRPSTQYHYHFFPKSQHTRYQPTLTARHASSAFIPSASQLFGRRSNRLAAPAWRQPSLQRPYISPHRQSPQPCHLLTPPPRPAARFTIHPLCIQSAYVPAASSRHLLAHAALKQPMAAPTTHAPLTWLTPHSDHPRRTRTPYATLNRPVPPLQIPPTHHKHPPLRHTAPLASTPPHPVALDVVGECRAVW